MRRLLLSTIALCCTQLLSAQTKTFQLYAVAEGNFGSPNADVFKVTKVNDTSTIVSSPLYQTANSSSGFDVIQDFEVLGNKAVFATKASNSRIVIASFPTFDSIKTFSTGGSQCLGVASATKAYVSAATGNIIRMVDMASNTLSTVSDPANNITSYASYMVAANGFMYVAINAKIVKIDTLTNAVTSVVLPNLGTIAGLQYDTVNKQMWILGKTGGISAVIRMDVLNNDFLNTPVIFTGVTNAAQLRFCNNKLYFLSGKAVHIYNILSPNIPTSAVYTSTLGGAATGFGYGKSFAVDPATGDFAIGHANGYASPSLYEVIDGTSFTVVGTGSIAGCRIVNELVLKTAVMTPPVPVLATLPVISAQCQVTLVPPTATSGTATIIGTTTSPLTYTSQGTYNVTWTYTNAQGSTTQTQQIIVADTIAPAPDSASLQTLTVACPYTITQYPTATDNCLGTLTATTTSLLTYTTAGTYTITWNYTDSNANTVSQTQTIVVSCGPTVVAGTGEGVHCRVWPNPASDKLSFRFENAIGVATVSLRDMMGKEVMKKEMSSGKVYTVETTQLPAGVYFVTSGQAGMDHTKVQKIVITH